MSLRRAVPPPRMMMMIGEACRRVECVDMEVGGRLGQKGGGLGWPRTYAFSPSLS